MEIKNNTCPVCGRQLERKEHKLSDIFPWTKDDADATAIFDICWCGFKIQIGHLNQIQNSKD